MVVFNLHLAANGRRQPLAGERLRMLRRLAAKDVTHLTQGL